MTSAVRLRKGRGPMYEKLLVAVDHSASTERVLAAARDLASLSGGEVWVLHLREREVMPPRGGSYVTETADEAQASVDEAVAGLNQAGVKAHGEGKNTLYGHAARGIIHDAKAHDVGAIIMGSRGRSDLTGLVLGSTAHKVIHLTDRPVLIVR